MFYCFFGFHCSWNEIIHKFKEAVNITSHEAWAFQYFDDEGDCVMVGFDNFKSLPVCEVYQVYIQVAYATSLGLSKS